MPQPADHRSQPASHSQLLRGALVAACLLQLVPTVGCSVFQQSRRTMLQEPSEYSWRNDRHRSLKVYRQWADQAWANASGSCPQDGMVDDYALGFRDGFVDFVYAGGEGEPPPVPPRKFWNVAWRTPEGDAAARQWFSGYRHGAQVARDGGYREGGIVPSSYRSGDESWIAAGPEPRPTLAPAENMGEASEMLPEPRGRAAERSAPLDAEAPADEEASLEPPLPEPPAPAVDEDAALEYEAAPLQAEPESAAEPDFQEAFPPVEEEPAAVEPDAVEPDADEADARRATTTNTSARERFRRAAVARRLTAPSNAQ
jgi:hypothetical protein